MIQNGSKPTRHSHKDRSLFKSFGFTGGTQSFPQEFNTDAGVTMPDQNADGQPYGCTNYTQAELDTDLSEGKRISNPAELEAITHANARGGYDIRESLLACTPPTANHPERLGWFGGFYKITRSGFLDWFDSLRLAQISGLPEKRSISVGTPWFESWHLAIEGVIAKRNPDGTYTLMANPSGKAVILPMPTQEELDNVRRSFGFMGQIFTGNPVAWHNHKLCGTTAKYGSLMQRDKSWQGKNIGEGGFVYIPREVLNVVLDLPGTCAYTATNQTPANILPVDSTAVQWIVSFIRNLLKI